MTVCCQNSLESVVIMCKTNPKFEEYVKIESGRMLLYVQLLIALYGCVVSALLWYQIFSVFLKEMGFKINPYDSCISRKIINRKNAQ